MKIKVQYTTLIVNNLEESVAFYRDALGFKEGYHVELGPMGRITLMKSADDGAYVELIESDCYDKGFYSIGTDVDDLDAALEHLTQQGVEIVRGPSESTVGKMAFVKDPNGINICLIEHNEVDLG